MVPNLPCANVIQLGPTKASFIRIFLGGKHLIISSRSQISSIAVTFDVNYYFVKQETLNITVIQQN